MGIQTFYGEGCNRKCRVVLWIRLNVRALLPSITHRLTAFRRAEQEYTAAGKMASVCCIMQSGVWRWSWRVSGFLSVFVSLRMRRQACRSSSGRRTHTTTPGQTALRDADQSPRVDILLPGGDGGLSPLLTCSSNVTMLTFYSLVPHTSRYINLRDCWLSFFPQSHRTSNAGLFVLTTGGLQMWFLQWSDGCKVRETFIEVTWRRI